MSQLPPKSILIVDDTPANLRLLSQMLAQRGHKIRVANSGSRALESVQVNPPDLILLDVVMPGMNGYEVCRCLKTDASTHNIPIIFLSALDDIKDKVQAFAVGSVDYITKPFQIEEVLARVETHLTLHELQMQLQLQNIELQKALAKVKALSGLLPICASCKKIRDDGGYWHQVEVFIRDHSEADFSHGICPDCAKRLYGEYYEGTGKPQA